jgi:hypothetical protein
MPDCPNCHGQGCPECRLYTAKHPVMFSYDILYLSAVLDMATRAWRYNPNQFQIWKPSEEASRIRVMVAQNRLLDQLAQEGY